MLNTKQLQQKIADLEKRLTEAESLKSEKQNSQIPSSLSRVQEDLFSTVEQLKEVSSSFFSYLNLK